jgi:hypothetical protein
MAPAALSKLSAGSAKPSFAYVWHCLCKQSPNRSLDTSMDSLLFKVTINEFVSDLHGLKIVGKPIAVF